MIPAAEDSAELAVVRSQVYADLDKPKQAAAELAAALARQPRSCSRRLQTGAQAAFKAQDDARAAELATRAVAINTSHWPSLLLLGRLALREDRRSIPPRARGLMNRALAHPRRRSLAAGAVPGRCSS